MEGRPRPLWNAYVWFLAIMGFVLLHRFLEWWAA